MTTINFDMDGTIANLYGVENWLESLINKETTPYKNAKPLINMQVLARKLNSLKKKGYRISIISWLAKNSNSDYDKEVAETKIKWLKTHLASVEFDDIIIVPYGTPKQNYCFDETDILFDDETHNRETWLGQAYDEKNIINILKKY